MAAVRSATIAGDGGAASIAANNEISASRASASIAMDGFTLSSSSLGSTSMRMTSAPGGTGSGPRDRCARDPMTRITSATSNSEGAASIDSASGCDEGIAPFPSVVMRTGAPSRSATWASAVPAPSEPPPATITGWAARANRSEADSTSARAGRFGSGSAGRLVQPAAVRRSNVSQPTCNAWGRGRSFPHNAVKTASTRPGMSSGLVACALRPITPSSTACWSGSSCSTPRPRPRSPAGTCPTRHSTREPHAYAVASPAAAFSKPGPGTTAHTPTLPVTRE